MRDPARIERLLNKIKLVWKTYPDLRVGQLIESVKTMSTGGDRDIFYVEDDILEAGLDHWISSCGLKDQN